MTNGFLSAENAKREIAKLKRLLKINADLKERVPQNELEESILPIQRKAVRDEIHKTMAYLRRWKVQWN